MPISGDSGIGLIKNSFSSFFGSSIKSPFWLALIITVVIILITIFVYPAKKSASISKLLKLMIYIFAASLIFLLLHDNALYDTWKIEHEDKNARAMIGGMSDFINNGNRPIIPSTFGGDPNMGSLPAVPRMSGMSNLIT